MSNIPEAREYIRRAYAMIREAEQLVDAALDMMDRRKPDFRHAAEHKKLTLIQCRKAKAMRKKGHSLAAIGQRLNVNIGRISEALNGKSY